MARRTRHGGTIGRHVSGRWWARVELGTDATGRRKRKYLYAHTKQEAAALLTEAKHTLNQGAPLPSGRLSLAQFMRQWLDTIQPPAMRPSSYASYKLLNRLHIEPALGHLPLAKLEPQAIQTLLNAKSRAGLSAQTVKHMRTVLRRALFVACKWRLLSYNAATLVDLPKADRPEITPPTDEQAHQLLDAAAGSRLEALLGLALRLGLRRAELAGLQWSDINFDQRQLSIIRALVRVNGQPLQMAPLKTKGSRRILPLPQEVVKTLRAHRVRQLQDRLAAGSKWSENDLVFPNTVGKLWEPRAIDSAFKRALKKADLPQHIRLHDCRHFCATAWLEHGVTLFEVSRLLGHSSITITANTYGHLSQGMNISLVEKMNSILSHST